MIFSRAVGMIHLGRYVQRCLARLGMNDEDPKGLCHCLEESCELGCCQMSAVSSQSGHGMRRVP